MSNKHICTTCLRGIRQQLAETRPQLRYQTTRPFTSSAIRRVQDVTPTIKAKPTSTTFPAEATEGPTVKKGMSPGIAQQLAQAIRYTAPNLAEPYVAYGATEILVRECARVADYTISPDQRMVSDEEGAVQVGQGTGWWYEHFGLQPCFNTWAQVTFLHMWMLTVRLRTLPEENAGIWHQQLVDHFFYLAEEKMTISHNIASRSIRNNYLKDLFAQWRGLTVGYDQGLVEGDAVLAAAIWRNVCGSHETVDLVKLTEATSYVRSVLQGLEGMENIDLAKGEIVFEDPSGEKDIVSVKSRLWNSAATGSSMPTANEATQGPQAVTEPAKRPTKWRKASTTKTAKAQ